MAAVAARPPAGTPSLPACVGGALHEAELSAGAWEEGARARTLARGDGGGMDAGASGEEGDLEAIFGAVTAAGARLDELDELDEASRTQHEVDAGEAEGLRAALSRVEAGGGAPAGFAAARAALLAAAAPEDFGCEAAFATWARRSVRLALAGVLPLLEACTWTTAVAAAALRARLLGHAVWCVEACAITDGKASARAERDKACKAFQDAVMAALALAPEATREEGKWGAPTSPQLARALHAASVRASLFDLLDDTSLAEGAQQMLIAAEAMATGALGMTRAEHLAGVAMACVEADRRAGASNGELLRAAARALELAAAAVRGAMPEGSGAGELRGGAVLDVTQCADDLSAWTIVHLSDYHESCAANVERAGALAELLLSSQAAGADSQKPGWANADLICQAIAGAAETVFANAVDASATGEPIEWIAAVTSAAKKDAECFAPVLAAAAEQAWGADGVGNSVLVARVRSSFAIKMDAVAGHALEGYVPADGLDKTTAEGLRQAAALAEVLEERGVGNAGVAAAATALCETVAATWARERAQRLKDWAVRSLDVEKFPAPVRPRGDGTPAPASQSAVDVCNMWRDALCTLAEFEMPFEEPTKHAAELLSVGCAKACVAYAHGVDAELPDPHSFVPPPPPLSRFKQGLHNTESSHEVADELVDVSLVPTLESLCARVNSMVFMASQLPAIGMAATACATRAPLSHVKAAADGEIVEGAPPPSSVLSSAPGAEALAEAYEQLRRTRTHVCDVAAYRVVFCEMNDVLGTTGKLYAGGIDRDARGRNRARSALLPKLDEALGALAGAAASRAARDALVSSLASGTMSALKRVLLDGGSSRSFACLDSSQVRASPQRFFRAEVASLPPARPMAWRACVRLPRARVLTPAPARPRCVHPRSARTASPSCVRRRYRRTSRISRTSFVLTERDSVIRPSRRSRRTLARSCRSWRPLRTCSLICTTGRASRLARMAMAWDRECPPAAATARPVRAASVHRLRCACCATAPTGTPPSSSRSASPCRRRTARRAGCCWAARCGPRARRSRATCRFSTSIPVQIPCEVITARCQLEPCGAWHSTRRSLACLARPARSVRPCLT